MSTDTVILLNTLKRFFIQIFISPLCLAGEVYRIFSFGRGTDPSTWLTLTDADEGFGYSKCQFTTSRNGCGLFHGTLNTQVPQDGKSYRSGFCALRAPKPRVIHFNLNSKSSYLNKYILRRFYVNFFLSLEIISPKKLLRLGTVHAFGDESQRRWPDISYTFRIQWTL